MTGSEPFEEARSGRAWAVGLVGVAIGVVLAMRLLVPNAWDPTALLALGEEATVQTSYAQAILGREVVTRPSLGHDGKFFFIQANDPFYLEPELHGAYLDRPTYRGQRMLYPTLGSLAGLLPPDGVAWGLVVTNVLAMGMGAWGTARLAQIMGGSAWWGLSFPLNLGLMSELFVGGAGLVAFTCAIWSAINAERGRLQQSAWWATGAVLSREVFLLFIAGMALWWLKSRGGLPWLLVMMPSVAAFVWGGYLRLRLGDTTGIAEVQELGVPFQGMVKALPGWLNRPVDLAAAAVFVLLVALLAMRSRLRPGYLGWGAVGVALLTPLLSRQVWQHYFDMSRALSPVVSAYILVTFARRPNADGQTAPSLTQS